LSPDTWRDRAAVVIVTDYEAQRLEALYAFH
jgi:hypothetical protein